MGEGREADRSTIRLVRVPRVRSGDDLGLQLAYDAGGSPRFATAGPIIRTLGHGAHATAAAAGNDDDPSRGRIRRLRVDC